MADEKTTSQAQQNHFQRASDEAERLEKQWLEQNTRAIDDATALAKGTIGYLAQLSAEWRRLTLDAVSRSSQLFANPFAR